MQQNKKSAQENHFVKSKISCLWQNLSILNPGLYVDIPPAYFKTR